MNKVWNKSRWVLSNLYLYSSPVWNKMIIFEIFFFGDGSQVCCLKGWKEDFTIWWVGNGVNKCSVCKFQKKPTQCNLRMMFQDMCCCRCLCSTFFNAMCSAMVADITVGSMGWVDQLRHENGWIGMVNGYLRSVEMSQKECWQIDPIWHWHICFPNVS